jgi:hypothetical protein
MRFQSAAQHKAQFLPNGSVGQGRAGQGQAICGVTTFRATATPPRYCADKKMVLEQ